MIGVYSRKAEIEHGSVIYITPEGEEVVVTAVYSTDEPAIKDYGWSDMKIVGPVAFYVRVHAYGRTTHLTGILGRFKQR